MLGRGDYHWQHEPCWYAVPQQGPLDRRPQADHALDDPKWRPGRRDRARHPEAGRVHAPADAQQQRGWRSDLRAFLGSGQADRRRDHRPHMSWHGDRVLVTLTLRYGVGRHSPAARHGGSATAGLLLTLSKARSWPDAWPPPRPTRLKALTGNPGKRPLNVDRAAAGTDNSGMPERTQSCCSEGMGSAGNRIGTIGTADRARPGALAAYCNAYGLWAEATEAIQKYGTMVKSPSGYPIQSPYVSIANRQAEIMMRIASEFGFTPASRSRITPPLRADQHCLMLSIRTETDGAKTDRFGEVNLDYLGGDRLYVILWRTKKIALPSSINQSESFSAFHSLVRIAAIRRSGRGIGSGRHLCQGHVKKKARLRGRSRACHRAASVTEA